ncbi:non-hydrolyzing UDP-N-acetylglucosamine 2-epimerase [Halosimplex sp. TS25]|uniref:non-hydrolyzing UDP-N-acetylglucosamine 2-epimerase n=1 Tax=Halosimplex rarum TaxID=3396619 RepID=UPI0039EAEF70
MTAEEGGDNLGSQVAFILGTRPEIIKLAPVIHRCEKRGISYTVIHTGQHYSDNLDSVFFDQLELPTPDYNLDVGSKSHGEQTGEMLIGIEEILQSEQPEVVLVQGDTNSVLAGAIATSKLEIELGHVEAGLRSFDRDMPEETNRVVADHVADCLFPPTEKAKSYLVEEGIPESRLCVTGNTIVDALQRNRKLADRKSSVLAELELDRSEYLLMTAHRAENVDDEDRFRQILTGVGQVADDLRADVIYPIHPRAESKLEAFDLSIPDRIRLVEPQEYLDFIKLQENAKLILTDSGGVQEEACILEVPCVTMRNSTERPETVSVGANKLSGVDPADIESNATTMLQRNSNWENPFGDGTASEKILQEIGLEFSASETELSGVNAPD